MPIEYKHPHRNIFHDLSEDGKKFIGGHSDINFEDFRDNMLSSTGFKQVYNDNVYMWQYYIDYMGSVLKSDFLDMAGHIRAFRAITN